jgi:hypothetical protein
MAFKKILLEGDAPSFDTDKIHLRFYSPQLSNVTKTDPPVTFKILNVGTVPRGLGTAGLVKMDGFTKIRLIVNCAMTVGQSGVSSIDIFNQTDNLSLVSLNFTDSIIQIREAVATIAITGIKRLYARLWSTVYSNDIETGEIVCQLEK